MYYFPSKNVEVPGFSLPLINGELTYQGPVNSTTEAVMRNHFVVLLYYTPGAFLSTQDIKYCANYIKARESLFKFTLFFGTTRLAFCF